MGVPISHFTPVRLADGVSLFQRSPEMLQFGVDATRTGIIDVPCAPELAALLRELVDPAPFSQVVAQVGEMIGPELARSLTSDLASYRVLVAAEGPEILLLGASTLAEQLTAVLDGSGMAVRTQLRQESDREFIAHTDGWVPLAVVDCLGRAAEVAMLARRRKGPVVPVSVVDSRVIIGPVRVQGAGPCAGCANLHFADRDAGWGAGVRAYPAGPQPPDPIVVAAGAAMAGVVLRRLAGVPDPPGVSAPQLPAGAVLVVDPFGPALTATHTMTTHPRCVVCY